VTGLYPDRHGTVNNSMQDPALGHFSPANRAANTDGRWWDEAEPILADGAQGRCTACSFLARAAAEIPGVRPDYDARGDRIRPHDDWQYASPVRAGFADLERVPPQLLLGFHHVPWDYRMPSGNTLWDDLVIHYTQGVPCNITNRSAFLTCQA